MGERTGEKRTAARFFKEESVQNNQEKKRGGGGSNCHFLRGLSVPVGKTGKQPYTLGLQIYTWILATSIKTSKLIDCRVPWRFSKEQYRFNCMLLKTPFLEQCETCNKSHKPYWGSPPPLQT